MNKNYVDIYIKNYFYRKLVAESVRGKLQYNKKTYRLNPHMESSKIFLDNINSEMTYMDIDISDLNENFFSTTDKSLKNMRLSGSKDIINRFLQNTKDCITIMTNSVRSTYIPISNVKQYLTRWVNDNTYDNIWRKYPDDKFSEFFTQYDRNSISQEIFDSFDRIAFFIANGKRDQINFDLEKIIKDRVQINDVITYLENMYQHILNENQNGEEAYTQQYCNYYDFFDDEYINNSKVVVVIITNIAYTDGLRHIYPHYLILEQPISKFPSVGLTRYAGLSLSYKLDLNRILFLDDNIAELEICYEENLDNSRSYICPTKLASEKNKQIITQIDKREIDNNSTIFNYLFKNNVFQGNLITAEIQSGKYIPNYNNDKVSINFDDIGYIGLPQSILSDADWNVSDRNNKYYFDARLNINNKNVRARIFKSKGNERYCFDASKMSMTDAGTESFPNPHIAKALLLNTKILKQKNINYNILHRIGEDVYFTGKVMEAELGTMRINIISLQPPIERRPKTCTTECVIQKEYVVFPPESRDICTNTILSLISLSDFNIYNGRMIFYNDNCLFGAAGLYGPIRLITQSEALKIMTDIQGKYSNTKDIEQCYGKYIGIGLITQQNKINDIVYFLKPGYDLYEKGISEGKEVTKDVKQYDLRSFDSNTFQILESTGMEKYLREYEFYQIKFTEYFKKYIDEIKNTNLRTQLEKISNEYNKCYNINDIDLYYKSMTKPEYSKTIFRILKGFSIWIKFQLMIDYFNTCNRTERDEFLNFIYAISVTYVLKQYSNFGLSSQDIINNPININNLENFKKKIIDSLNQQYGGNKYKHKYMKYKTKYMLNKRQF